MIDAIKVMLGDSADNYTDAQIEMAYNLAVNEVTAYCRREMDNILETVAQQIAVIKLQRIGTEGLASQSMGGVNEVYITGYPLEIQRILNGRRKLKVL